MTRPKISGRLQFAALAVVLWLVPVAQAASVKRLRAAADAVVIARPTEWTIEESGALHVLLRVEESVFDGPIQRNAVVLASADIRGTSVNRVVRDYSPRGLWFLKREESGWVVVSAIAGEQKALRDLFFALEEDALAEPGDRMSDEAVTMAAVRGMLASGGHPYFLGEVLGDEDSPQVRRFLWELVASPDSSAHVVGLSKLLVLGDIDALRSLRDRRDFSNERYGDNLSAAAPNAVSGFFRNAAPEAIQVLGEFSNDPTLSATIREASAQALSAMHPRESLPYLARLLDDANQALRARGSIGISFFANGIGAQNPSGGPAMPHLNNPSPSAYRTTQTAEYIGFDPTRETEFIAFWKAWWLEHQFDLQQ